MRADRRSGGSAARRRTRRPRGAGAAARRRASGGLRRGTSQSRADPIARIPEFEDTAAPVDTIPEGAAQELPDPGVALVGRENGGPAVLHPVIDHVVEVLVDLLPVEGVAAHVVDHEQIEGSIEDQHLVFALALGMPPGTA